MAFEQRPNSGVLFKNERKSKEMQPDFTGSLNYGGQIIKLVGWRKQGKSGVAFISLSVAKARQERDEGGSDDDIW